MPEFLHHPVLVEEAVAAVRPHPGGRHVDGTLGGAGHAAAVLRASAPTGTLFGCDRDAEAVAAASHALAEFVGRFEVRQGSFADVATWLEPASCDSALLDLGLSSYQIDTAVRGFSFQQDGPLDMRFDQGASVTAADWVNGADEAELARIFWELGNERRARRWAREIVRTRQQHPFSGTRDLAEWVEQRAPRGGKIHPATRLFQALRMAVNDELGELERGLPAVWQVLKPGGRLAVISFHSGEDRLVKRFAQTLSRPYAVNGPVDRPEFRRPRPPLLRWVERKPITPMAAEVAANPRARSARLRVMEKLQ